MHLNTKVWSRCEQTVEDGKLLWKVMEKWEERRTRPVIRCSLKIVNANGFSREEPGFFATARALSSPAQIPSCRWRRLFEVEGLAHAAREGLLRLNLGQQTTGCLRADNLQTPRTVHYEYASFLWKLIVCWQSKQKGTAEAVPQIRVDLC
jgi:hypothetical protein